MARWHGRRRRVKRNEATKRGWCNEYRGYEGKAGREGADENDVVRGVTVQIGRAHV